MKKIKLKDNIDLKILEKLQYDDFGDYYSKRVFVDKSSGIWTWTEIIIVRKDDRIIRTKLTRDTEDEEWFGYVVNKDHCIYDLLPYIEEFDEEVTEQCSNE